MKNPDSSTRPSMSKGMRAFYILTIIIAGVLVYSNTFHVPFYYDDYTYIKSNPHLRVTHLNFESLKHAALDGLPRHRPIPKLSFALNYYFNQYHVFGYHLLNLVIHLLIGLLLFFFIRYTVSLSYTGSSPPEAGRREDNPGTGRIDPDIIAFFATLIWLVHPINIPAVTYIVQRMTSLVALFYLLSMVMYVKGRMTARAADRHPAVLFFYFAACIIAGALALASKENAATLPIFIFLYEWFFFQNLSIRWVKRHLAWIGIAVVVFGVIALLYLGENPLHRIQIGYAHRDFTMPQRVMTEWRVVVYYISLLFYPNPSRLSLDHHYPLSHSLFSPATTILSLIALLAIAAAAVYTAKKDRLIAFCLLWYLGNLIIESSIIPIEIIYNHRNYLPAMMISLFVVIMVYRLIRDRRFAIGVLCLLVSITAYWTYCRNAVWNNRLAFWSHEVQMSPEKFRPHSNYGVALYDAGDIDGAIQQYIAALKIHPNDADVLNNLGNALMKENNFDLAIQYFSKALDISPRYVKARSNLATALIAQNHLAEAVGQLKKVLAIDPNNLEAHVNLGAALARMNKLEEAVAHYKAAIRIDPSCAEAYNNMGTLMVLQHQYKKAMTLYEQALEVNPGYKDAQENLNRLIMLMKQQN